MGLEYTNELTYGAYVYHNSYEKQSVMFSLSKQWEYGGIGVAAANGYEDDENNQNGWLIAPEFTLRYKQVRIKTTYPVGTLLDRYDVANVQFVIPLN